MHLADQGAVFCFATNICREYPTFIGCMQQSFRYNNRMHELPITQHIIEIAENHCRDNGGSRVLKVNLVIGDYSGYVGESVQMYFDVVSEGTLCEGAICEIEHIEPKTRCVKCGKLFKRQLLSFECPFCGGEGEPTDIGKEFYIDSIEIE